MQVLSSIDHCVIDGTHVNRRSSGVTVSDVVQRPFESDSITIELPLVCPMVDGLYGETTVLFIKVMAI